MSAEKPSVPAEQAPPREAFAIKDLDEAQEKIRQLVDAGTKPMISVPLEYADQFEKEGLAWLTKFDHQSQTIYSFIAGTIGIDPFLPNGDSRAVYEVDPAKTTIGPRFTGADAAFRGVIGFPNGIAASAVTRLGEYTKATWATREG